MTRWCSSSAALVAFAFAFVLTLPFQSSAWGQDCPGVGNCLVPNPEPGCEDEACCFAVCLTDAVCCDEEWDSTCVFVANAVCSSLCGSDANNSCFAQGTTPGCDNETCCTAVCNLDPFCCNNRWDQNCVIYAGFQTEACANSGPSCGDPEAGDCSESNGTPSCSDAACCSVVCESRPECCATVWDAICVSLAATLCVPDCAFDLEFGDAVEIESCDGGDTNDPCIGTAEPIGLGVRTLGRFGSGGDRDGFLVDLAPFDLDGDGQVQIRLTVAAENASFDLLADPCGTSPVVSLQSAACVQIEEVACVPAVESVISVTAIDDPGGDCDDLYAYALKIEAQDFCGPPCDNEGSCLMPKTGPGCGDSECCTSVCDEDPTCCIWEWDAGCALLAAELCGGPPPLNDACANAIAVFEGRTSFRQVLSTVEGPELDCSATPSTGDVWFTHQVACTGSIVIRTCGDTDFDSVLEVFRGGCVAPTLLACNDDFELCFRGNSEVEVVGVDCGDQLLIRVSGTADSVGNGELDIVCLSPECPCPADLNADGKVDGADFGLLLLDWGSCPTGCLGHLSGDLAVTGADIGQLLLEWGDC